MIKFRKSLLATAVMCVSLPLSVFAQSNTFTVQQIKIAGLQRVLPKTVLHYLPIHDGQQVNDKNSIAIIKALYKTGFFSDIQLNRAGNTLWVIVKERPTISSIAFSGNSSVTNKQLLKALHTSNITEGAFYDSSKLHDIVQGLKQLYGTTGHNHAMIHVKVKHASQNRIGLDIIINEGGVVKVSSVKIEGAKDFSQKELRRQLKMHATGLLDFLSSANKYTDEGVQNDIQALTNFYLDHGYLDFHVVSHHATLQADKKHVAVVFVVSEGQPYTISNIKFDNHSNMSLADIKKLMKIKAGEYFSRQKVIDTNAAIGNAFADKGYAFPNISMQPQVDQANHTVTLTVVIAPGKQITVRYINFAGNNMTEDTTLRHDLTFSEGSPYSQANLNESRRRFYNLPFISNVQEKTVPVPGTKNLVDIDYNVKEMEAGRAQIMGGYSDTDGFLYGVSLSEPNFKGEGKSVGINLTRSQLSTSVNFNYFNPFYSIHNIGRGFDLHYTKVHPNSSLDIASYDLNGYGADLNYSFPINNHLNFNASLGYNQQDVKPTSYTPESINDFIKDHPYKMNSTTVTTGVSFVNTDRYYFPTSGTNASLNLTSSLPVLPNNLEYYTATFKASWYHPLNRSHSWVLILHTNDGYGRGYGHTKYLPFMDNFYGGGITSVPGFDPNTLGPRDNFGNSLGGNEAIAYGFDIVFPNPIGHMVRTSLTVNGGNVYNRYIAAHPDINQPDKRDGGGNEPINYSGPIRYSVGLRIQWQMPLLGTIAFAIAHPLNAQKGDQTTWFNFNFGTSF